MNLKYTTRWHITFAKIKLRSLEFLVASNHTMVRRKNIFYQISSRLPLFSFTTKALKTIKCIELEILTPYQRRHGEFEPGKAQYSTPNCFDQLFLIRVYWSPTSRQGPGLGGLASHGGLAIIKGFVNTLKIFCWKNQMGRIFKRSLHHSTVPPLAARNSNGLCFRLLYKILGSSLWFDTP